METLEKQKKTELSGRELFFWQKVNYVAEASRVVRAFFPLEIRNYESLETVLRIYGYDQFSKRRIADMFRLQDHELLEALKHCLKEIKELQKNKQLKK